MNASMNDTHNLGLHRTLLSVTCGSADPALSAWKLAHVLHGWADVSILKTVGRI